MKLGQLTPSSGAPWTMRKNGYKFVAIGGQAPAQSLVKVLTHNLTAYTTNRIAGRIGHVQEYYRVLCRPVSCWKMAEKQLGDPPKAVKVIFDAISRGLVEDQTIG